MIKRTLCFTNPAYLSLKDRQMVIRLPEVEKSDMPEELKKGTVRTVPIEDIGVAAFDVLDAKFAEVQRTVDSMTRSEEWQNADLFGKIDIA